MTDITYPKNDFFLKLDEFKNDRLKRLNILSDSLQIDQSV
jgi:hypothetical protein